MKRKRERERANTRNPHTDTNPILVYRMLLFVEIKFRGTCEMTRLMDFHFGFHIPIAIPEWFPFDAVDGLYVNYDCMIQHKWISNSNMDHHSFIFSISLPLSLSSCGRCACACCFMSNTFFTHDGIDENKNIQQIQLVVCVCAYHPARSVLHVCVWVNGFALLYCGCANAVVIVIVFVIIFNLCSMSMETIATCAANSRSTKSACVHSTQFERACLFVCRPDCPHSDFSSIIIAWFGTNLCTSLFSLQEREREGESE